MSQSDEGRPILDMPPTRAVGAGELLKANSFGSISSLAAQVSQPQLAKSSRYWAA